MTDLATRLSTLPAAIANPLQRVLALAEQEPSDELEDALDEALAAAGFEPSSGRWRSIMLASELSPDQRVLAEVLAEVPNLWIMSWPLYCTPWLRRRWLGLEPGGVLFRPVELDVDGATQSWPLIHALRHWFRADERERALALLDALALPDRVEALVGLLLVDDPDFNVHMLGETAHRTALELADAEACPGASALTDWAISQREEGLLPERVMMLLFAALVCDGETIEPRHDALLWIGTDDLFGLGRRCIEAIPEPRRELALVAAIERARLAKVQAQLGLAYLPYFPYPSLARLVLGIHQSTHDPKQVLDDLQRIAKAHEQLGPVMAAFRAGD